MPSRIHRKAFDRHFWRSLRSSLKPRPRLVMPIAQDDSGAQLGCHSVRATGITVYV
jgi:hypothetical protein